MNTLMEGAQSKLFTAHFLKVVVHCGTFEQGFGF